MPKDRTKIECLLCHEMVRSVREHLTLDHPKVQLIQYIEEFQGAPLEGETPPDGDLPRTRVTAKEATAHPGGRHGAELEKAIVDPDEKKIYRADVKALIDQEHLPGYRVAAVAYRMLLARRIRADIENTRGVTNGAVYSSESLATLDKLEARIAADLRDLDAERLARKPDDEKPMVLIDGELERAEAWVRAHIGEFVEQCPNPVCGQILTAPALPHWAFEPIDTESGRHWAVWSPELWRLVFERTIPLWVMAFALRTSPEGLRITARRRGETWPDWIVLEIEESELRSRLDGLDAERSEPLTPIPPERGE